MFEQLIGSWDQPSKPFAGHSRLISRACLAHATADGLLLDRPERRRWRAALRVMSLFLFSALLVSKPVKTGAGIEEGGGERELSAQAQALSQPAKGSAQALQR